MGQKRVSLVDLSQKADQQQKKVSQKTVKKSPKKAMKLPKGSGKLADKGETIEDIILPEEKEKQALEEITEISQETKASQKKPRLRGRRYKFARSIVDRTITYPLDRAIELLKKTSICRFDGTITAHLNLKETGINKEITFPHSTGKQTIVAIATDATLKKVEKGKIDFDILLATPDQMKNITKVAKILGPKGLMPNPKNKTITEKPEARKKELESGKTQVKTESKNPLMHVTIGKTSHKDKHLIENVTALIKAVESRNIKKLTLASTMSPGVKVSLAEFKQKINN